MAIRMKRALAALVLSGMLVGGGTAIANAATGKASATTSSKSSSSSSSSTRHSNANCPNM